MRTLYKMYHCTPYYMHGYNFFNISTTLFSSLPAFQPHKPCPGDLGYPAPKASSPEALGGEGLLTQAKANCPSPHHTAP